MINGYGRNLIFLKFNDIVKGIDNACPWQNSLSAYGRLFLGNIKNIDKILYLDCDTVINGSLEELWSINIEKYYTNYLKSSVSIIRIYTMLSF